MVVYEILSGCSPYGTDNSFIILRKVLEGERPDRPQGEAGKLLTDDIWKVVKRCWKPQPSERAKATDVLVCLGEGHSGADEDYDQSDTESIDFQTAG